MKKAKVRILVISGSIFLALLIIGVIAVQVFFRLPQPSYSGIEKLDGLKDEVEVRTDEHGIPHIFAQNEADLFFAQGYITARERMFQMDLTRLVVRGELSSLVGEKAVKSDKFYKTLGLYRLAEAQYAEYSAEDRALLDAYTSGVNAYIITIKYLPCEYVILGAKPQLWKPEDSIVCASIMAFRFVGWNQKLILYQVAAKSGQDLLKYLIPTYPASVPTVSPDTNDKSTATHWELPDVVISEGQSNADDDFDYFLPMRVRASNWMIFSGSRTTTGKPIFSGSPDLEATVPSLFYLVHLNGGQYDVIGGSLPGVPGVHVLGFNGHIAWSATAGGGDIYDFYIEKLNADNPNQYMTEDGYRNFNIINETLKIKIKEGIHEEPFQIKISRHGPIISDVMPNAPNNCAFSWSGFQTNNQILQSFFKVNKAENFVQFRQACSGARGATFNWGYADIDGNIGYQYIATFPIRKSGDNPVPRPGEKGEYDWTGYVPFEDHPYDYNPDAGYLASFNQIPKWAKFYGIYYLPWERAERFQTIVKSKDKFSVDDVRKMQLDTVSNVAIRWIPHIVRVCNGITELKPYLLMIKDWDYSIDTNSPQATLFNSFYLHLMRNTFENKFGQKLFSDQIAGTGSGFFTICLINIMGDDNHPLWDDALTDNYTESRDDIILKSMEDAVAELTKRLGNDPLSWQWGKVHTMTIKHPLGSVLPFLNLSPMPHPGDDWTINSGYWVKANPYDMLMGGAIRIVVDMSDISTMTLISPAGQSGHYLSSYYGDQAELWNNGQQIPAHYTDARELKQIMILKP